MRTLKIMVASPGMISLTLGVPSDKDYDIYLYNPSQEEVDSSTYGAGATENINYKRNHGRNILHRHHWF